MMDLASIIQAELTIATFRQRRRAYPRLADLRDVAAESLIRHALRHTRANKLKAAELLGISRNTLHAKCRELGLEPYICDLRRFQGESRRFRG